MSAPSTSTGLTKDYSNAFRVKAGEGWANAWRVSGAISVLGFVGAGVGFATDHHRFAFSYLFAFLVALTIGLGGIFFTLIQHLTSAGWSVTLRRISEFYGTALYAIPLLFIPVALSAHTLYPWLQHHHEAGVHAGEHGEEHGHEHGHENAAAHDENGTIGEDHMHAPYASEWAGNAEALHEDHAELLVKKGSFLNGKFAAARALIYFAVWIFLAFRFFSLSTGQDKDGNIENTRRLQGFAPGAAALFALSLTFAGFDWIMSLEPTWYSTIFGVYIFAGAAITIYSLIIITTLSMKNAGLIGNTVTEEHYHDLGKMLFGHIVFWAYIGFSQFMLIWYASIPEETTFYHARWEQPGWRGVSLLLLFGHFVLPFLLIVSRNVKRKLPVLGFAAGWMLVMHVVDCYWLVLPYADLARFHIEWIDFACLFAVVGAALTVVFYNVSKHSLVAVGDPRIGRAIRHHSA